MNSHPWNAITANTILLTAFYATIVKLIMGIRLDLTLVIVSFILACLSVAILYKRPETRNSMIFRFWENKKGGELSGEKDSGV